MNPNLPFHARFAGLDWSSDVQLDQFDPASCAVPGAIVVGRQREPQIIAPLQVVGRASIAAEGVRFDCEDEVSLELHRGTSIGWVPGPRWSGRLPVSFYSSMAAITLAWRGIVPLHASTVALHGKAWLIAGNAGAGKSTLTAELLKAGAELLADDLTPLSPTSEPLVWRGRPAMRLHPATCDGLAIDGEPIPTEDGRGKMLVRPSARAADKGWPVGGILLLGETGNDGISAMHKALAYGSILFRPKIVSALPGRATIREGLLGLARTVPMSVVPTLRNFDEGSRTQRLDLVLATLDRLAAEGIA